MAARSFGEGREDAVCGSACLPARGRAGGGDGIQGIQDTRRCWAGAEAGRAELLQGRAGRTELPGNEGFEENGRPRAGRMEKPRERAALRCPWREGRFGQRRELHAAPRRGVTRNHRAVATELGSATSAEAGCVGGVESGLQKAVAIWNIALNQVRKFR